VATYKIRRGIRRTPVRFAGREKNGM